MTFDARETSTDDGRPIELFEFVIGTTTWRYTNASSVITRSGNLYTPVAITRGADEETPSVEKSKMSFSMPMDCEVAQLFVTSAPAEVLSAAVLQDHYGESDWQTVWKGRIVDSAFAGEKLALGGESIFASLRRPGLRRTYTAQCAHVLYGALCGVDREARKSEFEVATLGGSALTLVYSAAKLAFDGVDASTLFTDDSGKVWVANGNAQLDTAQFKYGTAALLLDGTGDYLSTPSHADFDIAEGKAFTIEGWVYFSSTAINQVIFSRCAASGTDAGYELRTNASGHLKFDAWGAAGAAVIALVGSVNVGTGGWHHVAVSSDGTTARSFLDGAVSDTGAAGTVVDATTAARLGASAKLSTPDPVTGWLDDFRFTQGKAHYTAAFTAPTVAVPATATLQPAGWFAGGYAAYADPDTGATMRHFVTDSARDSVTLATYPFNLAAGDTVALYPGCAHDIVTCDSKFANSDNYGGAPFIPKDENPFAGNRVF